VVTVELKFHLFYVIGLFGRTHASRVRDVHTFFLSRDNYKIKLIFVRHVAHDIVVDTRLQIVQICCVSCIQKALQITKYLCWIGLSQIDEFLNS